MKIARATFITVIDKELERNLVKKQVAQVEIQLYQLVIIQTKCINMIRDRFFSVSVSSAWLVR